MGDLFMPSHVPHVRDDGRQILRHVLRCRWCFAVAPRDEHALDTMHEPGCRVGALIDEWRRDGNSAAVVDAYDAICDQLDTADERPQS